MTTRAFPVDSPSLPFIFRYAEVMPEQVSFPVRYDRERQLSQVLVSGEWIDSADVPFDIAQGTSITATRRETTDDV